METDHRIVVDDSREMNDVEDDSVELVVTSPPYPMIEMWDSLFEQLDPEIHAQLNAGDGQAAFESMHRELDTVWSELSRVLVDGGIACINIGDATRKVEDSFRVYQNHSRITNAFERLGFEPLPELLWRKPVNSAAKFMGSGMLPQNAYVTLEHEYILTFRNGKSRREFEPGAERRYNSAYFWEERNKWFSDVWEDIRGELQNLDRGELRDRSAAYPFEVPYRLVCMYSVYGDTVLDPFWGTGTSSLAAMVAGRNSIGYEIEDEFTRVFDDRVRSVAEFSENVIQQRLEAHRDFVEQKVDSGQSFNYEAENYDFPVTTKQEKPLKFYAVQDIREAEDGYRATHEAVEGEQFTIGRNSQPSRAASLSDF